MRKLLLSAVCTVTFLTGCVETEILDDLNIETAKAYDSAGEETIKGTALFLRYLSDKSIKNVTLSAEAHSTREVLNLLEKKSEQPLVRGSLEAVIISEKLAKEGMINIADSLQRDASVGARVFLLISEGEAGEILNGEYGIKGNSAYITNLIEHNMNRGDLANTNLHLFMFKYFQKGQTSYLPLIKQVDKQSLSLDGIALFKKDKMIDILDKNEMFYFKLLADKYSEGSQVVRLSSGDTPMGEDVEASVRSIRSKNNIDIKRTADPVEINVHIELDGIIKEYTGKRVTFPKITNIEKKMEDDIEKHCETMLKRFQEIGIDPVGFGQRQKHGLRGFDFKKWENQIYPDAVIKVTANVNILESGTVE